MIYIQKRFYISCKCIGGGELFGYKADKNRNEMEQLMEEMEKRLLADRVSKQEEVMKALSDVHHLVGTQDVVLQPKKDFMSKRPADVSGSSSEDHENG